MAATTWSLAPWMSNQTWLLKDNTVVKTPDVETTTSQRRVRIAGTTKSVARGELDSLLIDAVRAVARRRGTEPWVRVATPDENLPYHGAASPSMGKTPDYSRAPALHLTLEANKNTGRNESRHTDITFEFASVECPTVTAVVWVYLEKDYSSDHIVKSGITFRALHESNRDADSGYAFWNPNTPKWWSPYGYYDHSDEAEAAKAKLEAFDPIPGIEWVNQDFGKVARRAVTEALKLLKQIVDVEEITLPVWRDNATPEPMKYKFTGRTNFTGALYREMLDFVQTNATIERIQENYRAILRDLATLGLVGQPKGNNKVFAAVEQAFAHDLVCHMIPQTVSDEQPEPDKVEVVPDGEHTVSIDLATGTLVVNCLKDGQEEIEQWNFQRFQAELTGELDAFLGFARQAQQKRNRKRLDEIKQDRSSDEGDLEIDKFSK